MAEVLDKDGIRGFLVVAEGTEGHLPPPI